MGEDREQSKQGSGNPQSPVAATTRLPTVLTVCHTVSLGEVLEALAYTLDLEWQEKLYHAIRVAILSAYLAKQLLPEEQTELYYAGLAHDVGAVDLPHHMVHSPELEKQLRDVQIRLHPLRGVQIVSQVGGLESLLDPILYHHEWWDGSGYPCGLTGQQIPVSAQAMRAADAASVLFWSQKPKSLEEAVALLAPRAGKEFSEEMFEALVSVLESPGLCEDLAGPSLGEAVAKVTFGLKPLPTDKPTTRQAAIRAFSQVIDAKHSYTAGHSQRVAYYARLVGERLEWDETRLEEIEMAALVHDAGKTAVPRSALDRAGKMTPEEWEVMRRHTIYSAECLEFIRALRHLAAVVRGHHERFDGSGYPDGLKGPNIPVGARVLAIADAFDAMTAGRPYQPTRTCLQAEKVLVEAAGTQFDPQMVRLVEGHHLCASQGYLHVPWQFPGLPHAAPQQ